MRKFLFAFLGLLLSATLVFSASAVAVTQSRIYRNEDYLYEVTEDNTITIHYYIGSDSLVTIPAFIEGLPVKVIEERAFCGSEIKTAVISEGIEVLMNEAFFHCKELRAVSLPSSLEKVGVGVFRDCMKLKTVTFAGGGDSALGGYMFYGCISLTDVTLPAGATYIPTGMFGYCQSLSEIKLPESVTFVYDFSFYGSGLVQVKLPTSLKCIYEKAFAQSTRLESIIPSCNESGYYYIAEDAFEGCIAKFPDSSVDNTDPTEPTDSPNVPSITEPVPPWNPDTTTAPEYSGSDATTDEEDPTTGVVDPTEPKPPESTITQDGYYMGSSQGFLESENEHISSAEDMVAKRKEELLGLAWNVRIAGDSNKDFEVNIKDATNVQKYVALLIDEDSPNFDYKNSDVDTDGQVTVRDATQIQKFIAGLTSSL